MFIRDPKFHKKKKAERLLLQYLDSQGGGAWEQGDSAGTCPQVAYAGPTLYPSVLQSVLMTYLADIAM